MLITHGGNLAHGQRQGQTILRKKLHTICALVLFIDRTSPGSLGTQYVSYDPKYTNPK